MFSSKESFRLSGSSAKSQPAPIRSSMSEAPSLHSASSSIDSGDRVTSRPERLRLDPRSSSFKPFDAEEDLLGFQNLNLDERKSISSKESGSRHASPFKTNWTENESGTPRTSTPSKREFAVYGTPSTPSTDFSPFTPNSYSSGGPSPYTPPTPYTPYRPSTHKSLSSQREEQPSPGVIGSERGGKGPFNIGPEAGGDTPENIGRFLMIADLPKNTDCGYLLNILNHVATVKCVVTRPLQTMGCIVLVFFDPRDTYKVFRHLQVDSVRLEDGHPPVPLHCFKVDKNDVLRITGKEGKMFDSVWRDSESTVLVEVTGDHELAAEPLKEIISTFGDLQKTHQLGLDGKKLVATFYDTRCAIEAVECLHHQKVDGARLSLSFYNDDPFLSESSAITTHRPSQKYTLGSNVADGRYAYESRRDSLPSTPSTPGSWLQDDSSSRPTSFSTYSLPPTPHDSAYYPEHPSTPTYKRSSAPPPSRYQLENRPRYGDRRASYDTPPHLQAMARRMEEGEMGAIQSLMSRADITARNFRREGLGGHYDPLDRQAIPEENRVFPQKIISGEDTRTTVMVKDVPNKLSRQELVDILSQVVPGEFDFVYLRFDFKNHCNVGYAFVNFTSVAALLRFIKERVGKKWNLFSSEKVLQISYANIQGKAALINKFRNSAVMGVKDEWHPQVFYSSGALKGQPEPFPECDDPRLRQRSSLARLTNIPSPTKHAFDFEDLSPHYEYNFASRRYDL